MRVGAWVEWGGYVMMMETFYNNIMVMVDS